MGTDAFKVGDTVRHVSDPHGRWAGEIIGKPDPTGTRFLPDLHQVRWQSGLEEYIHTSELRKVD